MNEVSRQIPIRYSTEDIEKFCRISHDKNPLHTDPDYASGTFFGEQVVYGMLGLITGLKGLDSPGPVALEQITARFIRPLFLGVDYVAEMRPSGEGRFQLDITAGSSKKTTAMLRTRPWRARSVAETIAAGRAPRRQAASLDLASARNATSGGSYRIPASELLHALDAMGIGSTAIAPLHVAALCWASYLIGMELPGRQALFSSIEMTFEGDEDLSDTGFDYASRVTAADERMNMLTVESELSINGRRFATATMTALVRPIAMRYDMAQFAGMIGKSDALAGKVAFVSGSGRGLGSLLAMGCALQGSDVVLHFNRNREQAENIKRQIEQDHGRRCLVLQGDIREQATWDNAVDEIRRVFGRLDIFVNNAWPPILPLAFDELSDDVMNAHIFENIRASVLAYKALLPLLQDNKGLALNISSRYVQDTPRDFAHYAAAKSAIEGLGRGLAASVPSVTFVSARLPKIQTDQTNVPVDVKPAASPFGVVGRLLEAMKQTGRKGYQVIEDF